MKRKEITKTISFSLAAALILTASAAVASSHEMPGADAEAFWKYVTEKNPYTEWDFWPGKEEMYEGTHPHGAYLKLYVNKKALKALKAGEEMPNGAIVLKENYGKDRKTLMAITPMYKVEGFNPEGDDWFWAKYKADGSVEKAGKVDGCIKCHAKVKDNNWTFNKVK
jgi:hypothetical protein